jgi:sporulation protein YlmC with PRC-barrel domain
MEKIKKITDLLFTEVVSEDGTHLGRVFDLRSKGEPEHGLENEDREITEILYGARSFWEMLGIKETELKIAAWSAVKKIEDRKIVIREIAPEKIEV